MTTKMKKTCVLLASAAAFAFSAAAAQAAVTVTTGAGYVKMVEALVRAYEAETKTEVHTAFGGNIGQMLAQVESGSGVNVVISDKTSLKKFTKRLAASPAADLGTTPLVLIWKKGLTLTVPEDIAGETVKSAAYPDPKAAVYGRAAKEYLVSTGLGEKIAAKVNAVSTVPQVFSYVATGEMDAGFVNLLAANQGKAKIGGMLAIEKGFTPIEMTAMPVKGQEGEADVQAFLKFLSSEKASPILEKFGVVRR